jgi:hypothetical protein
MRTSLSSVCRWATNYHQKSLREMVLYCSNAIQDQKSVRDPYRRSGLGPSGRVPARDSRCDHDKHCRYSDCNEPTYPVNSRAAIAAEGCVDKPTDENTADPAEDRKPKRRIVPATWRDELAQQSDDDPSDNHSDYFHSTPFLRASPGHPWPAFSQTASTRGHTNQT